METLATTMEVVIIFKKYILTPIMNQLSYLYSYSESIQSMRDQVEKLNQKRSDLQSEVEEARRNTRTIASGVRKWIEEVEIITKKEKEIMEDEAQAQKGCFYGIFPNIKLRYSLSKKAKKTTEVARELLRNEGIINKISHPTPLEPIPSTPSVTEIDSRKSKENEIMEALNDNNVYVIALCGMGGVGKTTMAKTIKNKVEEGKIFEEVAMVVVSRQLDLKNVQQGIAEGIGLKLEEQTIGARAQRLHMRLKETRSILIILDDVWEKFILQEIGIPSKETHQRCKIILTSRIQSVCKTIEGSTKIIKLDILSEQEAWNLFKEKSGEIVDEEKLHLIAREVARECKGLPLALVTVAAALRDSSLPSWEDAFHQLKTSILTDIQEVYEEVYVPLKWSYDQIRNEEARYLFLLCCLFPEDYEICLYVLLEYGFSLRIFANTINLEEARNRVYGLVEMLIHRFLLIRVDLSENIDIKDAYYMKYRVKIHDVIRDMGISIASKDRKIFMLIHDPNLREWPKKDFDYGNCTCISLQSSTNISLLENIHCPRLELLHVDSPGVEIQESSFDKMEELRVLSTCMLKSLPPSLSRATNLRSLILFRCEFKHFPSEIGECVNLEILSLRSSAVETLPEEIGKLKNLKLLDLRNCWNLRKIPQGAISGLVQLEELYMIQFYNWGGEDDNNASIAEVLSLKNLTILQFRALVTSTQILLQNNENLSKLKRYYVVIGGDQYDDMSDCANLDRCIIMKLLQPEYFHNSMHLFQVLFDNAQAVELVGDGTTEIAHKLSRHGYKEVERLKLRFLGLEFLFDSSSWNLPDISYFPCLTTLALQNNKFLKEICNGHPPNGSFSNLISIELKYCDALNRIFSYPVVAMLSKLESLEIIDCETIEGLFVEREIQNSYEDNKIINSITLPRLFKIKLNLLPRLGGLYWSTEDLIIELPKLCEVEIVRCSSLKSFRVVEHCSSPTNNQENIAKKHFFMDRKVMFGGLKKLYLDHIYNSEIFDPKIPINNLVSLESLIISTCNGCVSLFSNSMSRAMHNLKELCISRSGMLQEVIAKENDEQTSSDVVTLFSQLKELRLWFLPRMIQFCHGSDHGVQLPSLELLHIRGCELMETFCRNQSHFPSSRESNSNIVADDRSFFDEVMCIKLKELDLNGLDSITRIFGPKILYGNFSSLQRVDILYCRRLRSIFSLPMFRGLVNLQVLQLLYCPKLEEVIPKEDLDFPSLETLQISNCSNLKSFCTIETKKHIEEEQSFFHQKVGNFFRLKTLYMVGCCGFINLFPSSTFVQTKVSNLKILYISECEKLQEVIAKKYKEEESSSKISLFTKLEILNLQSLPSIKQFCHLRNFNIEFPSLEQFTVCNCELMETFSQGLSSSEVVGDFNLVTKSFFTEVTCNKLKEMKFNTVNGAEELFGHKISIGNFSRLESLEIRGCKRLRSVFSAPMFRGLVNLKVLKIMNCPELQQVISKDEKEAETKEKEVNFPQLRTLYLDNLPKLVRFCHIKNDLELPSLQNLELSCCYVLETFSLGLVHLPSSVDIFARDLGSNKWILSQEELLNQFNLSISDKTGHE